MTGWKESFYVERADRRYCGDLEQMRLLISERAGNGSARKYLDRSIGYRRTEKEQNHEVMRKSRMEENEERNKDQTRRRSK